MKKVFYTYVSFVFISICGFVVSGGNEYHVGTVIGVLVGYIVCQPWIMLAIKTFPDADFTLINLTAMSMINTAILGYLAFKRPKSISKDK
ncbi:MAG: hypothetical protein JAZ15_18885 [Candidatus Thiodiazotropha endolucinida]|nr:hypothetical protein [Candidatus Thiodiazotropha taylori]MCW4315087.1 hypothetical protein [Candidatus Thiodiazotropha taylori]